MRREKDLKLALVLFVVLVFLSLTASCTKEIIIPVDETNQKSIESRLKGNFGSFNYEGTLPSINSKVPTCQNKEPKFVHFEMFDENGNYWERESPLNIVDDRIISEIDSIPVGKYTFTAIELLSDDLEIVYTVPDSSEPDFHDYATTILPIEVDIENTNSTLEGVVICYIPNDIEVQGGFGSGLSTVELQTVVMYVTGLENDGISYYDSNGEPVYNQKTCIDLVQFVIDGYIAVERYIYNRHVRYPVVITTDYDFLRVFSYDDQDDSFNYVQVYEFSKENPYTPEVHGALLFDKCN